MKKIMEQGGLDRERLQLVWVSAAEGQIFQDKVNAMKKKLSELTTEEIRRGMLFFGEREKRRMERLVKVRQKLTTAVEA